MEHLGGDHLSEPIQPQQVYLLELWRWLERRWGMCTLQQAGARRPNFRAPSGPLDADLTMALLVKLRL